MWSQAFIMTLFFFLLARPLCSLCFAFCVRLFTATIRCSSEHDWMLLLLFVRYDCLWKLGCRCVCLYDWFSSVVALLFNLAFVHVVLIMLYYVVLYFAPQCFDCVGWMTGGTSGLRKV